LFMDWRLSLDHYVRQVIRLF